MDDRSARRAAVDQLIAAAVDDRTARRVGELDLLQTAAVYHGADGCAVDVLGAAEVDDRATRRAAGLVDLLAAGVDNRAAGRAEDELVAADRIAPTSVPPDSTSTVPPLRTVRPVLVCTEEMLSV
jgi:hypothetical protein